MKQLDSLKNKYSTIPFIKNVKKNIVALQELNSLTSFLDSLYEKPTFKQRMFHFMQSIYDSIKCKNCQQPSVWNSWDAVNYKNDI